jgi:transposase-like protein
MRERPSPIRSWMSCLPEARSSITIVCYFAPGASVSKVAQHYGVNANLLFTRRRRQGKSDAVGGQSLLVPNGARDEVLLAATAQKAPAPRPFETDQCAPRRHAA